MLPERLFSFARSTIVSNPPGTALARILPIVRMPIAQFAQLAPAQLEQHCILRLESHLFKSSKSDRRVDVGLTFQHTDSSLAYSSGRGEGQEQATWSSRNVAWRLFICCIFSQNECARMRVCVRVSMRMQLCACNCLLVFAFSARPACGRAAFGHPPHRTPFAQADGGYSREDKN